MSSGESSLTIGMAQYRDAVAGFLMQIPAGGYFSLDN